MTTMKKTHWFRTTLIVLIICGLVGTVLAAVLFGSEGNRTYAASSIQFSFDGAAEGKAPNGYPFDVTGFTTDEVLESALEASGLTGTYTAEQIRENLVVTGQYPEKIAEQMTKYVSLLDADANLQAALADYHATQYSVTLYNDFDRKIASGKLTELLGNILTAYRNYFAKTYSVNLAKTDAYGDLSYYDYAQQLEVIKESVSQQSSFVREMVGNAPEFQLGQKGFNDFIVRYQYLDDDIDRLDATITLNAISKDRERLKQRYEMEIRTQQIQMETLTEELKLVEEQVSEYDKDGIIYVSASGELSQIGKDTTGTYDRLVAKRKQITEKIADTSAKISLYQARLDDMTGAVSKKADEEGDAAALEELSAKELDALKATVEKQITALNAKKEAVDSDLTAMLEAYYEQEINERTVSVTEVKYKTPTLLSGAFIVKVLKTAGPICAVGFMVCMVLLIISRRKEEKALEA